MSVSLNLTTGTEDRAYFLSLLERLAEPVLTAAADRSLRGALPVPPGRELPSYFGPAEAVTRLLAGISPWLESDAGDSRERCLREKLRPLAKVAITGFTDPRCPDFVGNEKGHTHIEAAYLGQALLQAPGTLWESQTPEHQTQIAAWMRAAGRAQAPVFNNHLLFHSLLEAALARFTGDWDRLRVDYALRQHEQWYAGDGWYLDGPEFHQDYYNSFVIHAFLLETLRAVDGGPEWDHHDFTKRMLARAQRHAVCLERLISPEATIPVVGRSIVYRAGTLTLLAYLALNQQLPGSLPPGQVRAACAAVTRRLMEAPGVFDQQGWLQIGWCGAQDDLGEPYIAVSSLYLAANILLPLGLPPEAPFWSEPAQPWTSRRAYSGQPIPRDHSLSGDVLSTSQLQWGTVSW